MAGGTTAQVTGNPVAEGVTVAWLALAFGLTEQTVRYKLKSCPVLSSKVRGTKQKQDRYELRVAAGYLVKPAFGVGEYMKALKRGDLPPQLQESTWSALLKQQAWEERAGDLYRAEKVREVFRQTFQTIKAQIQLWVPTLERNTEVSREQREALMQMADALQAEIYASLVKQHEESQTGPQLSELPGLFGAGSTLRETMAEEEGETFVAPGPDDPAWRPWGEFGDVV